MKKLASSAAVAAIGIATALGMGGCSSKSAPTEETAAARQPVWVNGSFEDGGVGVLPPGWTATSNLNPGVTIQDPQTFAGLNLAAGGDVAVTAVGAGLPETFADPDVAEVKFPRYGQNAAVVNFSNTVVGDTQNVNTLSQTMTVGPGDIDPVDGKIHARFTIAPILENPNHAANQQPYYFVLMTNQSNGNTVLTQDFEVSNAPGVPWQTAGSGALYTSWQLVDLDPGSVLAIGDVVDLKVIAAGCSLGGHFGRVYVDAFGNRPPGTFIQGRVQKLVNAGDDLAYDLTYENGGNTPATSTVITFATPNNTTFKAISGINGCTTPAIGATGNVTCPIGTMPGNTSGAFKVTVTVDPLALVGTRISQGNYKIKSDGLTELLGPHLRTDVTLGVTYADVRTTISSGLASINWADPITYTITAKNFGPNASPLVNVTDTFPAQLTGITWTCVGTGGGICGVANGTGNIATTANLPLDASVTYTVSATVIAGSGTGKLVDAATATPGAFVTESASFDNTASETLPIGPQQTLTLTKNALGTISSIPQGLSCGTNCTTATTKFATGSQVVLHADPPAGGQFVGWGGACAGTVPDCTLTMSAAQTVTAQFVGPATTIAVSGGATQSAKVATAFAAPLQVVVKDAANNAVPNVWVSYAVPSAGASALLSSYGVITDVNGNAAPTALANTVSGTYVVNATFPGALAPVTFNLTNTPDVPAGIRIANASGNQSSQVGTAFGSPLVVTVVDKYGNPVPNANVTFGAPSGEPTAKLGGTKVTTDGSGNASVTATAGSVSGTYVVNATLDGDVASVDFLLTNTGVAPLSISVVSGSPGSAVVKTAFTAPLKVLVTSNNVPVSGAIVTFAPPVSGASATLAGFTAATDQSGLAQISATANSIAGTYAVVVSTNGAAKPVSFALTNTAGAPAALVVSGLSSPQSAPINSAFPLPLVATVVDADGNPIAGAIVTFTVPGAVPTGTVSSGTATTDANGQAKVLATAGATVGSYTVVVSTTGAANAAITLNNTGIAPNTLAIDTGNPQSTTVATAFGQPLVVKVLGPNSLPVVGATVSFNAPATGASATLSAPTAITNGQGLAQVVATAGQKSGTFLVQASLLGTSAEVAFQLTSVAGAATQITLAASASPQSTVVTTAFSLPLRLIASDAFNNPFVGAKATYLAPGAEPTAVLGKATATTDLDGATSVAAIAGKAPGSYDVNASISGIGVPGTFKLTNTQGKPTMIAITAGGTQTTPALTVFKDPIVAKVTDANGAPVAGATIQVTAPSTGSSGTFVPQTVLTDVVGSAAITVTANDKPGTFVLALAVQGAATPANASLTITGVPTTTTLDVTPGSGAKATKLVATVAAKTTPTGVVRFQVDGKDVGTGALTAGSASLDVPNLAVGAHQAIAFYDAQGIFEASSSSPKSFTIEGTTTPTPNGDTDRLEGGGVGCNASGESKSASGFVILGLAGLLALIRDKKKRR
ncbi:hypothetical protein BH09MYX1_BH09MYX1_05330 [soil metagenome]